jgi:hypothetical protein
MASTFRYRGGDTKEVLAKTHASYPIEEGDLVFRHPADKTVRAAADMPNQGSIALNQDAFAEYFLGVALQKNGLQTGEKSFRLVTDEGMIRVATAGRFEFDCAATQWQLGDPVAVGADTNGCFSQKVAAAATDGALQNERAIARAVPGPAGLSNSMTRVTVEIVSRIMNPDVPAAGTYSGASGQ